MDDNYSILVMFHEYISNLKSDFEKIVNQIKYLYENKYISKSNTDDYLKYFDPNLLNDVIDLVNEKNKSSF